MAHVRRAFGPPWVTLVDGLIEGRARIDGATVAPHSFIPSLAGKIVGLADQRLALLPSPADREAKTVVIARDFAISFVSALRSPPDNGRWWDCGPWRDVPVGAIAGNF